MAGSSPAKTYAIDMTLLSVVPGLAPGIHVLTQAIERDAPSPIESRWRNTKPGKSLSHSTDPPTGHQWIKFGMTVGTVSAKNRVITWTWS